MTDIPDPIDDVIDAYLDHLETGVPAPDLTALPEELRAEAQARIELLRGSWGALADLPSLADDPVAARFGFDRAGQDIEIAGARLSQVRQERGLDLKALATQVAAMGADIAAKDLWRLERAKAAPVAQHLVSVLIAVLDCTLADLETADADPGAVRAFLDSPAFLQLVDEWAAAHARDPQTVRRRAGEALVSARFRAEAVTTDQLIEVLRVVLADMER